MVHIPIKQIISPWLVLILLTLPGVSLASLNVFACEPEWAALAKALGGDKLTLYAATTSMQDPHHIQARPSLIAKARRADLLICSGAELEAGWLPLLLRKSANAKIQQGQPGSFLAADFVKKMGVPEKIDRSLGDVHAEGNPHIHTNPDHVLTVAKALARRLAELDNDNADFYLSRLTNFETHWASSILGWKEKTASIRAANIVTHHTYWTYLNQWLGMNVIATLEPVPGVSPSSSHLAKLKKQLAQRDIKMILRVNYASERPAHWLADQINVPVVALPATVDYQAGQTLSQWFDIVITRLSSVNQ